MRSLGLLGAAALVVPVVLWANHAHAGGLFAGESGSAAQSRGGAFVARADDPTALMHNPAGLMKTIGYTLYVGANVVFFHQSFDRSGVYQEWESGPPVEPSFVGEQHPKMENNSVPQPIPLIAFGARFDKFAIGVGVMAPQGYPNRDYDKSITIGGVTTAATPQRYDVVSQESIAALPSVAVAYSITPQLDIGLRASWGFGTLKAESYTWGTVNQTEDFESDGLFLVDVTDKFIPAFGLGLLYRPIDGLEIGFNYASSVAIDGKGTGAAVLGSRLAVGNPPIPTIIVPVDDAFAQCEPGGTQEALKACVTVTIPQTATIGARWVFKDGAGREKGDVEIDFRWENWGSEAASNIDVIVDGRSAQDTDPIIFVRDLEPARIRHGFKDVFSVRIGGQWALGDFSLKGGLAYDTAAAPTSWSRLDIDGSERYSLAGGLSYTSGKYRFDLGGAAIISPSRTVEQVAIDPADINDNSLRQQPDPVQPLMGVNNQGYDPINNGTFESGYFVISTGITVGF